ncbi:hypothetical protein [Bartonella gliris]|uniref:hypothetical protein n=1 Tax=Bartonella gliris TaxID=3004109 RepID=UPI003872B215
MRGKRESTGKIYHEAVCCREGTYISMRSCVGGKLWHGASVINGGVRRLSLGGGGERGSL